MMYKRIFTASIALAGLACLFSFTRFADDPITLIRQQLEKWTAGQPIEKVYLQLDKPYYAAGDDIWFKAYVVNQDDKLSSISGIVNVELIDQRDSIIRSDKLALASGTANGDFALPDTLHPGNYRIRAYTNYMRTSGSDYFFDKAITIINNVNPGKPTNISNQPASTGKIDVQFFPESGYLVNGIESEVAFKAVAPNGLGINIKGTVTDSKGQQVAQFTTSHLGMGKFNITPVAGNEYKAAITNPDGSIQLVELPKAKDNGYNIHIADNGPQEVAVVIQTSPALVTNSIGNAPILIAQSGGKICYTGGVTTTAQPFKLFLSKTLFRSGIVQFTLFSPTDEPVNERLLFIQNPADQLKLSVSADQQVYAPRQRVRLTLDAQNGNHEAEIGNFSVAVTDESRVPVNEDTENNILANLLLTSDLRGYIEQPAWYFNNSNAQTSAALDLVMLTQGYHRFEWKELLKGQLAAQTYQSENSLQVSGTVVVPGGTKPVVNAKVTLYNLDSIQFTREAVTDASGRFSFKNLTFDDSVRFIVQARTDKNKKDVDIKLDKIVPPVTSGNKYRGDFQLNEGADLSAYAQSSKQLYVEERPLGLGNHISSLQEVIIREKKEALRYSQNLNGAGNADQIILGKTLRDMGCITVTDCLAGRLVGVAFHNGIPYSTRDQRPMQLVVDGVYLPWQHLNNINYNDIQAIEVLRSIAYTAVYGSQGSSGLFVITTRHGNDDDDDEPQPVYGRGITTYFPKGYYKAREFYSPRYDRPKTDKQLADLRTTIYWKPTLLTGSDGKASIEYFNAGSKGTYRVVVEGIGNDGSIGRQVFRYKVQ